MDVIATHAGAGNNKLLKKIKVYLVFFSCALVGLNCSQKGTGQLSLEIEDGVVVGIRRPLNITGEEPLVFRAANRTYPLSGRWEIQGDEMLFRPLAGFEAGADYIVITPDGLELPVRIPRGKPRSRPFVEVVYPTGDTLPENLLKFHILFSEPMQFIGNPLDYIDVVDLTTNEHVDIFLELETPLWNPDRTELTLWLDPGRIKTGLIPNRESGTPLMQGHRYRMDVSQRLRAANGNNLEAAYALEWCTGAPDRVKPEFRDWHLFPPAPGSNDSLRLYFGEAFDAGMLTESFDLRDGNDNEVLGSWKLGTGEREVYFVPLNNWNKDEYIIFINPILEDLAGNNLQRLFDTNLESAEDNSVESTGPELRFRPR